MTQIKDEAVDRELINAGNDADYAPNYYAGNDADFPY
jgi:hypothetical protein